MAKKARVVRSAKKKLRSTTKSNLNKLSKKKTKTSEPVTHVATAKKKTLAQRAVTGKEQCFIRAGRLAGEPCTIVRTEPTMNMIYVGLLRHAADPIMRSVEWGPYFKEELEGV